MGRPRKSADVKTLQGTFSPSREPQASSDPLDTLPAPPAYFGELAREEWAKVGALLIDRKILHSEELLSFAGYCYAKQIMHLAAEELERSGITIPYTNKAGKTNKVANPAWKLYKEAHEKVQAVAARFGLDPVSRLNVPGAGKQKELTPFERAINGTLG